MNTEQVAEDHVELGTPMQPLRQRLIYPVDEFGFVIWTSDGHRFIEDTEENPYVLLPHEIDVPIPQDVVWFQPRWDGTQWVEGKDHSNLPIPEPSPEMEVMTPQQPYVSLEERVKALETVITAIAFNTGADASPIIEIQAKLAREEKLI